MKIFFVHPSCHSFRVNLFYLVPAFEAPGVLVVGGLRGEAGGVGGAAGVARLRRVLRVVVRPVRRVVHLVRVVVDVASLGARTLAFSQQIGGKP